MNRRSLREWSGMLAILLPGAVAAVVVGRVLPLYWGHDRPATLIVVSIACALGVGLFELIARQVRVRELERELSALPSTPREATLDIASSQLAPLLRARLERAPSPALSDGIAPFLSGLLVMLGLLGTLLGLFQTVHGAGEALTTSGDVDALRRSLRAPIDGLTRSFGCSAAGISASAMLGLALALVRRREARMLRAVQVYAAGPLRSLSQQARQTRALEQLVAQNNVLPAAVNALEKVAGKLGELSGQLLAQHQAMLASVHGEFAKAAVETGRAMHEQVSPLLEQLAARSGEALSAQSSALAEVARDVTREIERDARQRRDEAAQSLEAMRARLDVAENARATAHGRELEALTGLHTRTLADSEHRWAELLERLDQQLEAARAAEQEQLRRLDAQAADAREREREQIEQLEDLRARVGSELERLSAGLGEQLEQRLASEREHDARAERTATQLATASAALEQASTKQQAALERVDRSADLFDAAIARQDHGLLSLIERVGTLLPQLTEAAQTGAFETLARLRELGEAQATRLVQLESTLADGRAAHARELAERVTDHAWELEQRLEKTSEAVQEASAIWQASSAEMQGVAQLFASSVDRQREASEAWLESLGDVEAAVERAGQHAASDALSDQLASTQELFTRQLQFQRELLEQLRALRSGGSTRFASGERDVSTRE
ncbi:MAG TPA: hypothetical protein VJV78_26150 [Polyangiales bacterium]|nr:hypothetical protein [Polyangiales bacterium]